MRPIKGKEYAPETLKSFQSSISRELKEEKYGHDILTSPLFQQSRDILAAKKKDLKNKGLGNRKNKADVFTKEELNILLDKGLLGAGR